MCNTQFVILCINIQIHIIPFLLFQETFRVYKHTEYIRNESRGNRNSAIKQLLRGFVALIIVFF